MHRACALPPGDHGTGEVQHQWAICRTTAGNTFPRNSTDERVRGYQCRDRRGRRDLRRCNKSWRWWRLRPQVLWGDCLWSRWTWISRLDRQTSCCRPRERNAGAQPFFIPETRTSFQPAGMNFKDGKMRDRLLEPCLQPCHGEEVSGGPDRERSLAEDLLLHLMAERKGAELVKIFLDLGYARTGP